MKEVYARRQKFLNHYRTSVCNITDACKAVGVSRQTYYDWYKKSGKFRIAIDHIKEELIGKLEKTLYKKALLDEDFHSIKFALTNLAPDRWRNDKVQVTNVINNKVGGDKIGDDDRALQDQLLGRLKNRFSI